MKPGPCLTYIYASRGREVMGIRSESISRPRLRHTNIHAGGPDIRFASSQSPCALTSSRNRFASSIHASGYRLVPSYDRSLLRHPRRFAPRQCQVARAITGSGTVYNRDRISFSKSVDFRPRRTLKAQQNARNSFLGFSTCSKG